MPNLDELISRISRKIAEIRSRLSLRPTTVKTFEQEPTNRGTIPREPYRSFARKKGIAPATPERYPLQDELHEISPESFVHKTSGTTGRERPQLIRNRTTSTSSEKKPGMVYPRFTQKSPKARNFLRVFPE